MKGDFSRLTFDVANHFSRVLMQQGRVTVDADPNEQAAILLHYLRTLARDLIGPCGGPVDHLGFQLRVDATKTPPTLTIGAGRYYVDGILCENESDCSYRAQPDFAPPADDGLGSWLAKPDGQAWWLYLDVWERHITFLEDDRVREVALGGPDTCSRAKVVWQVKALPMPAPAMNANGTPASDGCTGPLAGLPGVGAARLAAELDPGQAAPDPCVTAPDARYRGAENQLYRVEIHRGGTAGGPDGATFKWSRDNGSVAARGLGTDGNDLLVGNARGFSAGVWVELTDDALDLSGAPGILVSVTNVDGNRLTIDPATVPASALNAWAASLRNPKVRRWDESENDDLTLSEGAVPIVESTAAEMHWIDLEDGLRVVFAGGVDKQHPTTYRSGDYWLITARVATGDIEWPHTDDGAGGTTPSLLPPRGVRHHYAPLGWLSKNGDKAPAIDSCLCTLPPLSPCARPAAVAAPPDAPPGAGPAPAPAGPKGLVPKKPRPPKDGPRT